MLISNVTILFSNSSPKIHKSSILCPTFRHFCFFVKFRRQVNLRVLVSNMTKVSLKFLAKNTQIRHFWSKIPNEGIFSPNFTHFCFFTKYCNCTNSTVLTSNMTIVFKILVQKYPNKVVLVPNLGIFIISEHFAIRQIQGLLISNMTIVLLKLQLKNIQIRQFLFKNT